MNLKHMNYGHQVKNGSAESLDGVVQPCEDAGIVFPKGQLEVADVSMTNGEMTMGGVQ